MFRFIKKASFRFDEVEEISAEFQEQIVACVLRLRPVDDVEADEVSDFFEHLQRRDLWIACDCQGDPEAGPDGISPRGDAPVLHVVDGKTLRRQAARGGHHPENCDFEKRRGTKAAKKDKDDLLIIEAAREPRDPPESYRIYRRFTQRGERFQHAGGTAERRRRFSTHAHLLFTLLERADINRWRWKEDRAKRTAQYERIREQASALPISREISVGDVIVSYPSMVLPETTSAGQLSFVDRIRNHSPIWPHEGRPLMGSCVV